MEEIELIKSLITIIIILYIIYFIVRILKKRKEFNFHITKIDNKIEKEL